MKQLVRLRMRSSRDGSSFAYFLDYRDEHGKRKRLSLGHADRQKAKRQQAQRERELRMGIIEPQSMKLSDFVTDSLAKTGDQIRESTREEYRCTMRDFIRVAGDKDLQRVSLQEDAKETWAWLIEDCDRRTLPLTDGVVRMLIDHQIRQPEKHPYVFVLPARYAHIQGQLRAKSKWRYSDSRQKVIPKFNKAFGRILRRAGFRRNGCRRRQNGDMTFRSGGPVERRGVDHH